MIQAVDIGCEPSPSVPAETVIQDGWITYLLFFAVSRERNQSGFLTDLGVAVVACTDCQIAKFGYPNDEGLPEHPLYDSGIEGADSSVLEVVPSNWVVEMSAQTRASAAAHLGGAPDVHFNVRARASSLHRPSQGGYV